MNSPPLANPVAPDQLHDVILPPAPGWWPPAPGWWVVLLIILTIVAAIPAWLKRRKTLQRRRQIHAELTVIYERWNVDGDGRLFTSDVSILLKRVALSRYAASEVAGLKPEQWVEFLDRTGGNGQFTEQLGSLWIDGPYRPQSEPIDGAEVYQLAKRWLTHNL